MGELFLKGDVCVLRIQDDGNSPEIKCAVVLASECPVFFNINIHDKYVYLHHGGRNAHQCRFRQLPLFFQYMWRFLRNLVIYLLINFKN